MGQQSWTALANDVTTPVTAITSHTFTGPQDITIGNQGTLGSALSVPAGMFRVGQGWRFTAAGTYSVTGTPTLAFGLYVGTAAQASNTALTASSGVTTMNWRLTATGVVRSIGPVTQGTMLVQGLLQYQATDNAVSPDVLPINNTALAAGSGFSTITANDLTLKATYSASSASNIVVLHQWLVEYLN